MSFLQNASLGGSSDNYSVMYDDLSLDAQEKLSLLNADDQLWKMLPIANLYVDKNTLSQEELDDTALLTAGYYRR